MIAIIQSALARPRTVLLLLTLILIAGTVSYVTIPKESDPDINIPIIYVSMNHEGISPGDAERLLIRPMEQELRGIEGVKEMRSTAYEGGANVILEFDAGFDADTAIDDVRAKVDLAKPELPDETDEPTVNEVNLSLFPVIVVTLSGDVPERTLLRLARDLQDEIEGIATVLEANLAGDREELVEIVIDPMLVESYALDATELIEGPVGLGADAQRLLLALGADLGSLALAFGLHPAIDRLAVLGRQVRALDAHVDDFDAKAVDRLIAGALGAFQDDVAVHGGAHLVHQGLAFARDHIDQRHPADRRTQAGVERRLDQGLGARQRARRVAEGQRIDDAVEGIGVHDQALLVGSRDLFGAAVDLHDAFLVERHAAPGKLEVQPRLGHGVLVGAELEHEPLFALVDGEHRHRAADQQEADDDQDDEAPDGHWPLPVVVPRWSWSSGR